MGIRSARADGRGAVRTRRDRTGGGEQLLAFCNNSGPGFFSACAAWRCSAARVPECISTHSRRRGACDRGSCCGATSVCHAGRPFRGSARRSTSPRALPAAVQSSFTAVGSVSAFVIFSWCCCGSCRSCPRSLRCRRCRARRCSLYGDDERRERPVATRAALCSAPLS